MHVLRVRDTVIRAIREFLHERGFLLLDTPILTRAIGEEAGSLFETEYFDLGTASLAQTGQLYGEAGAMAFGRIYCFGPTFRAEKSKTRRHLTEFWMVEPEMAWFDWRDNMDLQEDLVVRLVERALDERRAWFAPTTWGQLDNDREECHAMTRVRASDLPSYQAQSIKEVWFTGCHSDIGGGWDETASIALRWMLGESTIVAQPLLLNNHGTATLAAADPPPEIHPSWTRRWRAAELVPRREIDNSGLWPAKKWARGHTGTRDPGKARRESQVHLHASAGSRMHGTVHPTARSGSVVPPRATG